MIEKKKKIETGAIEDVIGQINTESDAKTIAHLTLSEFGDKYNPLSPETTDKAIDKALNILQKIHGKGYDMKPYCLQMRYVVAAEYASYEDKECNEVRIYTLKVMDRIVYKSKILQNKPGTKIRKKLF